MRILVCGDLHCKLNILQRTINKFKAEKFDKVVFLGDYCDDWNAQPEDSYQLVSDLIEFKKEFPDKVILLLGNHDLSEWMANHFYCSGFNPTTHFIIKNLFEDNQDLFQLTYSDGNHLYSHAGVEVNWLKNLYIIDDIYLPKNDKNPDVWSDYFNWVYRNRDTDEIANKVFPRLADVGGMRGGLGSPSLIWADKEELIRSSLPFINQIVGHTPVKTITKHIFTNGDSSKNILFFCDTHSTYSNGENYGNNDFLTIEGPL